MKKPAKTDAVFFELVKAARQMRTVTYPELAKSAGLAESGVGMGYPLGYIRDAVCRPRGLPWLTVIAVSGKTGRPGDSFLPTGAEMDPDDLEVWRRAMVLHVFATDWRGVECGPPLTKGAL